MTILPSLCLRLLKGRSCVCRSSARACVRVCVQYAKTPYSALTHSRACHQLKPALGTLRLTASLLSLFMIRYRRSSCVQRVCTFLCRRTIGSTRSLRECQWCCKMWVDYVNVAPSESAQVDLEFKMGREGRALIAGTVHCKLGHVLPRWYTINPTTS